MSPTPCKFTAAKTGAHAKTVAQLKQELESAEVHLGCIQVTANLLRREITNIPVETYHQCAAALLDIAERLDKVRAIVQDKQIVEPESDNADNATE